jgi:hypothetical protein
MLVLAYQQVERRTVAALDTLHQLVVQLLGQLNLDHALPALLRVGPAMAGQWDNVVTGKFHPSQPHGGGIDGIQMRPG